MAKLSAQEIYRIARQAGFSPDQAVTMTAIALAESGGRTDAHNSKGEDSRGLWQINMRAHASWVNQMGLDLWDPLDNAKAAFRVSGGGANISPWTVTHRSKGAPYTRYQQEAIAAARAAGENASGVFSGSGGYGTTTAAGGGDGSVFQAAGGSRGIGPTEAQPNESPEDYARRVYGMGAVWLDHPEVGPILKRAAAEGWSRDRLEGALSATDWWVQTTQSKRQWDALKSSDPNEAESRIGERIAVLEDIAQELGLRLSPEQVRLVAENSLQWGWNDAQVRNALGAEAVKDPAAFEELRRGELATQIRSRAREYAVPLSDQAMDKWLSDIATGKLTEKDFDAYLRDQAKALFPMIAASLDAGVTTQQYFDPYRQIAAQTLSLNPEQIDLTDPKWMAALATPTADGVRAPLRLDQWQEMLMTDERYGWHYTKNANDMAERFAEGLARTFGKVA